MSAASDRPLTDQFTAQGHSVVFFDGVCGLCNTTIDFILQRDHAHQFRFAPLQGETARQELPSDELQRLDTLVLKNSSGTYRRSAAVVRIAWGLPGMWSLLGWVLWLVPLPPHPMARLLQPAQDSRCRQKRSQLSSSQ
jgi:predicted DCC family thiol-disulfide oxidoreductase YuxK